MLVMKGMGVLGGMVYCFAVPKSASFGTPVADNNTLSGLISRWMIRCVCTV
jgi:hypothetical protein